MQHYRIALTGTGAETVVVALEQLHGQITVMQLCLDAAELAAVAASGSIDAGIIVTDTADVTLSLLERFHEAEVATVVLSDVATERERCFYLGAEVAATDITAEQLANLIVRRCDAGNFGPKTHKDVSFTDADMDRFFEPLPPVEEAPLNSEAEEADVPEGRVITFWGPSGAPGTTTLAVNAAAEYALAGKRTLLVDADSYASSVAAMLGLLAESSGLSQLCRLAELGNLNTETFGQAIEQVRFKAHHLDVLSGIPHPSRWPELRATALQQVFDMARELYDVIVIDTASSLEQDEELSFDVVVPQRNAATLRSIEVADTLIAVGAADAIQLPRMLKHSTDLLELVHDETEVKFVLNKVQAASVGGQPEEQLRYSWARFGPGDHPDITLFPAADKTLHYALLTGQTLAEAGPDHALRAALQKLLGLPATTAKSRWRRRFTGTETDQTQRTPGRAKRRGRRAKH
ncbi:AAA family ATPase [Micrococcoides hystricis]|uniref:CpaE family protein n=1 Tax=Micrococcoides hystricis TaxID=1572761 RepID=A0ABV6P866_9MICC